MRDASRTRSRGMPAVIGVLSLLLVSGCSWQLQSVTGKTKFGPEFRRAAGRHDNRWTSVDQEFEFKWDNGWSTLVGYRRMDVDGGRNGNDNRISLGWKYPLWKRKKVADGEERRFQKLEARLAKLEEENAKLRGKPTRVVRETSEHLDFSGTN